MPLKPRKKKQMFFLHARAHIGAMWTYCCRIALCAEQSSIVLFLLCLFGFFFFQCFFFFFLVFTFFPGKKMVTKRQKKKKKKKERKKWAQNTINKECPHFALLIFEKRKKEIAFLPNIREANCKVC